jgi:hypothetical protein
MPCPDIVPAMLAGRSFFSASLNQDEPSWCLVMDRQDVDDKFGAKIQTLSLARHNNMIPSRIQLDFPAFFLHEEEFGCTSTDIFPMTGASGGATKRFGHVPNSMP